jgi:hypothetical protein
LGTFWLKIEQSWPFQEISIFSNGGHLGYRTVLTDTILKGTHPGTIPARLGLIWFSSFRGEDLNVKVYNVRRMPNDGKSSHGFWLGELKNLQDNDHLVNLLRTTAIRVCKNI